jgi:uncharacterized protein involved in exopolysaccharide biosynthesis
MSEELKPVYQNDEIDLFELIETLWKEKLWILLFTILTAIGGTSYAFLATPKYLVSLDYTINAAMPTGEVVNRVIGSLPSGWVKLNQQNRLTLETLSPESVDTYETKFRDISTAVSKDLLAQAQSDVGIILNELPTTLQSTEAVAVQMLNAKKTVRALIGGSYAIDFGTPGITQVAPKKPLILALSIVLGGMIGVMYVLIRSAVRNRRNVKY